MENPGRMSGGESIRHPNQLFDRLSPGSGRRASPILKRSAVHELGDEILLALEFADSVNGEDVRMVQGGGQLGLALESPAR